MVVDFVHLRVEQNMSYDLKDISGWSCAVFFTKIYGDDVCGDEEYQD